MALYRILHAMGLELRIWYDVCVFDAANFSERKTRADTKLILSREFHQNWTFCGRYWFLIGQLVTIFSHTTAVGVLWETENILLPRSKVPTLTGSLGNYSFQKIYYIYQHNMQCRREFLCLL